MYDVDHSDGYYGIEYLEGLHVILDSGIVLKATYAEFTFLLIMFFCVYFFINLSIILFVSLSLSPPPQEGHAVWLFNARREEGLQQSHRYHRQI